MYTIPVPVFESGDLRTGFWYRFRDLFVANPNDATLTSNLTFISVTQKDKNRRQNNKAGWKKRQNNKAG